MKIVVREILERVIEVPEVKDESQAIAAVKDAYKNEEIVLDESDFIEVKFEVC